ncbi:TspO/MBR family protein [Flavobacterium sp.]|uniref:TspO/MBR family protein n=1 Tax=Flavobacterium sp. TaxID=239 RepID=UPI00260599CE|nr:TspO/MBR family protein [Flavobacterium sp.]
MNKTNYSKTILSIIACILVGFLSSLVVRSSVNGWFLNIEKPFFNPPNWVFMTAWTILYVLMGYSFAVIWTKKSRSDRSKKMIKKAMIIFGIQLLLNGLWTVLFFGLCNPFLALIEILILWLIIFETIKAFNKIDNLAAKLLIPYLVWVSFAAILNGSIWYLNS